MSGNNFPLDKLGFGALALLTGMVGWYCYDKEGFRHMDNYMPDIPRHYGLLAPIFSSVVTGVFSYYIDRRRLEGEEYWRSPPCLQRAKSHYELAEQYMKEENFFDAASHYAMARTCLKQVLNSEVSDNVIPRYLFDASFCNEVKARFLINDIEGVKKVVDEISAYQITQNLQNQDPDLLNILGLLSLKEEHYKEAEKYFTSSLALKKAQAGIFILQQFSISQQEGVTDQRKKQIFKILTDYVCHLPKKIYILNSNETIDVLRVLSICWRELSDYKHAAEYFRAAIDLMPMHPAFFKEQKELCSYLNDAYEKLWSAYNLDASTSSASLNERSTGSTSSASAASSSSAQRDTSDSNFIEFDNVLELEPAKKYSFSKSDFFSCKKDNSKFIAAITATTNLLTASFASPA